MSEVPDPLRRLNVLHGALTLTHETVYDFHLDLVRDDRATAISQGLLAESARNVLQNAPEASATARRLATEWHEQSVLDPKTAEQTALELDTELAQAPRQSPHCGSCSLARARSLRNSDSWRRKDADAQALATRSAAAYSNRFASVSYALRQPSISVLAAFARRSRARSSSSSGDRVVVASSSSIASVAKRASGATPAQ